MPELESAREHLRRVGWLSATPHGFREAVLERCVLRSFAPQQSLFHLADPPGGIYGLVSGGLAIMIGPAERGLYYAHFARTGFWFGEGPALTDEPRRVGVAATRQTTTLHLPLPAVRGLIASDPETLRWLALITLGHLDMAIGASDDLMIRNPARRTIAVLLRLAGCRHAGLHPAEIDVSQEDLARMANLSRNGVGTILRRLEKDGLIEVGYRHILLLRPTELRARLQV